MTDRSINLASRGIQSEACIFPPAPRSPVNYRPLKEGEIRLIRLSPATETGIIECYLVHMPFHYAIQESYEALSYTWGSPNSHTMYINIDNSQCDVRENLWWALYHLQGKVHWIWIDALCINQADEKERNYQVGQMGEIYKNAKFVDVWLGQASPKDTGALEALQYLLRDPFDKKRYSNREAWLLQHLDRWRRIAELFTRPYWTRLWIIQEFTLGREIRVYYDHMRIEGKVIWRTISQLGAPEDYRTSKALAIVNQLFDSHFLSLAWAKYTTVVRPGLSPLLDVIYTYRKSECFDARDQIFGLHSMANDCCRTAVPVDYSKSLVELYIESLEHHLLAHGAANILHLGRVLQYRLFKGLSLVEEDRIVELAKEAGSRTIGLFQLGGQDPAAVAWVSPRLNSTFTEPIEGISEDIYAMREFPNLSSVLEDAGLQEAVDGWGEWIWSETHHVDMIMSLEWPVSLHSWNPDAAPKKPNMTRKQKATMRATLARIRAPLERAVEIATNLVRQSRSTLETYRLFLTDRGEFRIGPATVEKGDWCFVVGDLSPDFIVRTTSNATIQRTKRSSLLGLLHRNRDNDNDTVPKTVSSPTLKTVGTAVPITGSFAERSHWVGAVDVVFHAGFEALVEAILLEPLRRMRFRETAH